MRHKLFSGKWELKSNQKNNRIIFIINAFVEKLLFAKEVSYRDRTCFAPSAQHEVSLS